jgi:DNA-binding NarL/FixJ family response regulator
MTTRNTSRNIRIVLVEDLPDVRESWRQLINGSTGLQCIATCASAEEALGTIPPLNPDVVLMDIFLPRMSGVECTARLKLLLPHVQIVILTVSDDSDFVFRALEAGANGYLLKRTRPDELRAAILDVVSGGAPMSSEIARRVVASFRRRSVARGVAVTLTAREEEVLSLLSKGYANKEIADKLGMAYETVREHLKHIYEKLHVHSRTEAVARYFASTDSTERD